MSYILDALKKAEAERDQPASLTFAGHASTSRRVGWIGYAAGALIVVALGGFGWWAMTPDSPARVDPSISKAAPKNLPKPQTSASRPKPAALPAEPEPMPRRALAHTRLGDLPQTVRDDFPGLVFSQLIYSEHADLRAVVVNGTRRLEGDEIAPELRLDAVTETGVVLEFRGYLVELNIF